MRGLWIVAVVILVVLLAMVVRCRRRCRPPVLGGGNDAEYKRVKRRHKALDKKWRLPFVPLERPAPPSARPLIVVPYRDNPHQDRAGQLAAFVRRMPRMLRPRPIDILVVEQSDDGRKFNKGALGNIGVRYAARRNYTTVVFNDVDTFPDRALLPFYYAAPPLPMLMATQGSKYASARGGVVAFTIEQYREANGHPNTFWGWGGEDTAFAHRVAFAGYPGFSVPARGRVRTTPHPDTRKIPALRNTQMYENLLADADRWRDDGYNSVEYTTTATKRYSPTVKKITVRILTK
jgi:hypothetical protein